MAAMLRSISKTLGFSASSVAERDDLESRTRQEQVSTSYKFGDVNSLVRLHTEVDLAAVPEHNEGSAGVNGDYIRAFILGGLDGAVSTFALVAGLGGAKVPVTTLIAVGIAKVVADALSMGFGEFMSSTAELDRAKRIRDREIWEVDNYFDGEVKEMCEIYMQRGISKEDTVTILSILSKYKTFFVEHMMVMEHGVMPPEDDDRWAPVKSGIVCFVAFILFGMVPLLGFIVMYMVDGEAARDTNTVMLVAYLLTAVTLFTMGVTKAKLASEEKILKAGVLMLLQGTVAGGAAYYIGERLTASF